MSFRTLFIFSLAAAGTATGTAQVRYDSGVIHTVVGKGSSGGAGGYSGDGGPATNAQLSLPASVAVDRSGNLFIADYANAVVRKVDSRGTISTYAGDGVRGDTLSGAASSSIDSPRAVAVDGEGNLYIAEQLGLIQKVDLRGNLTTVAGSLKRAVPTDTGDGGPATSAMIGEPSGVAVDRDGNFYISDSAFSVIRKVDAGGIISTVAGEPHEYQAQSFSGDGGPATKALLSDPQAIAVDSAGNLYIADTGNQRIRKVGLDGVISTVAGDGAAEFPPFSGDGGPAVDAQLYAPSGVAVDGQGDVLIADSENGRVRLVGPDGTIRTVAGNGRFGLSGDGGPAVDAELDYPGGLALDRAGNLLIADENNNRIRKVEFSGMPMADEPFISLPPGRYSSLQYADLSDTTQGATIYYTLDGSDPSAKSQVYRQPIYIGGSYTLNAVAMAPGFGPSAVASATYEVTLPPAAAPGFFPAPGRSVGKAVVTLSDATAGAVIHYTVDGSQPGASSPVYTGPLTLAEATTIRAVATAGGYWRSPVVAGHYSVIPQTPVPVISLAKSGDGAGASITIRDGVSSATIRYTTDGSTPTTSSTFYSGPFAVAGSETVMAIAISTGAAGSEVASLAVSLP